MKLRKRIPAILAGVVFLATAAWAGGDNSAERIFYNGKIFTAEPEHPYAEAVLIRGDKIVAVGNTTEVMRVASDDAEKIDLHGRMLLPGLIDSHVHAIDGGISLNSADIGDSVHSIADLAAFAAEAKKTERGCAETSWTSADCLWKHGRRPMS